MAAIEVSCSQCGSGEYRVVDERTGEVTCLYCRNRWIVPELEQKSETEKFLEQQAQQPRVIYDNTSETDHQLMGVLSGLVYGPLSRLSASLMHIIRLVFIIAGVAVAIIVLLLIYRFLS
jgi:uncharacterized Zn finger protein (UPF0148 family)